MARKAQIQNKVKRVNKSSTYTIKGQKKRQKGVYIELNTMMPNAYTASQRAQLKDFEKKVMTK